MSSTSATSSTGDDTTQANTLAERVERKLANKQFFSSVLKGDENDSTLRETTDKTIIKGSGEFINTQAARRPDAIEQLGGEATLNAELLDIRELVSTVFKELNENYILDPRVQGEVTIQTNRPFPKEHLLPILETLLQANGATLVRDEGIYKILPLSEAARGNLSPRLNSARLGPGYSVRIFPLQFVSATEMQTILQPFAPEGGILLADAIRNLLVLAGTSQELRYLAETIEIFDVNWLKGMSVGMYVLNNIESQEMAQELDKLFGASSQLPLAGLFRFVPINRLNAILVITPQAEFLNDISVWIDRLDGSGGERLYVYEVKNSDAEYLSSLLNQIFEQNAKSGTASSTSSGRVAPNRQPAQVQTTRRSTTNSRQSQQDDTTNNTQSSNSTNFIQPVTQEQYIGIGDELGVYQLSELDDEPVDNNISPPGSRAGPGGEASLGAVTDEIRIIPDVENNSLLIWANAQDYDKILGALRKLDISPRQVLIEATIAEVTLGDDLRYGVQWWFKNRFGSGRRGIGSLGLATNIPDGTDANVGDVLTSTSGFGYAYAVDGAVRALLNTLADESRVRVLSSPQVLVLDNQEARIRVGDNQPVVTGTTTTDGGSTTENIQFKETGVTLEVQPQVNAGGMVTLNIKQEVTDVGEIDEATGQRSFLERSIDSKVAILDNQTIVLGGLIRERNAKSKAGVPVLHQIPVVGALFGSTTNEFGRTELIILITPRVIQNSTEAGQITQELKERMKGIIPLDSPWKSSPSVIIDKKITN